MSISNSEITEINKKVLIKAGSYCEGINTDPNKGKPLQLNLEFYSYADLGLNIESLLFAVTNADEESIKSEPIMYQYITLLATELIKKLPLEFVDKLLIKESYTEKDFVTIKDL